MDSPLSPRILAYLALGIGILGLGFSAIFVRWADAPGPVSSMYRMIIAVAVLAWPFFRRLKGRTLPAAGIRYALLGGLFFAADLIFWSTGVVRGGATIPTLLANTAPVWVGLGALILFRERLGITFWAGLLVGLAGSALILGTDFSVADLTAGQVGAVLGLVAGLFYAGYFLITQRGRETLDSLSYFWPAAAFTAFGLAAYNLAVGYPLTGYDTFTLYNFLALGLITQVGGYLAINYALGYLPASIVSPTLLGQPVVTALAAWPLLGERLSPAELVGAVAVLLGVYLVHRSRRVAKKEPTAHPKPRTVR